MNRTLLAALLLVGLMSAQTASASGGPFEWIWTLNDSNGDPYELPIQGNFFPDDPRVLVYTPGNHQPYLMAMNGGLQVDVPNNQLVVDNIPQSRVNSLVSDLAGKASISHTHTSSQITNFNSAVDARIASTTGFQSDWNQTSTTSSGYIKNKPTFVYANPTRSLNTAFQISTTSAQFVSYTVDVASTLSLTGGETGTVSLQYADDSGFTTNVVTVQSAVNGNTGTLTIGLALTQTGTASVTGVIPLGKYVRIATANTAGTPTFTFRAAQEVRMPF